MYYTILVIYLLPVSPQFLGNMFRIGLAEGVEQTEGLMKGVICITLS